MNRYQLTKIRMPRKPVPVGISHISEKINKWISKDDKNKSKFISSLLCRENDDPVNIENLYKGYSAFLICGGPSFAKLDHFKLRQPGVLTLAVNNAAKTFRPNLWTCVDNPDHFIRSIWLDPTILKFVPIEHANKQIFNSDQWTWTSHKVSQCPSVVYYRRNEQFQADTFLAEDTINWGNHRKYGGGRSVMLPAIRILHYLGIRRVFLLGVDMRMDEKNKYHFKQDRSASSIKGNNSTYEKLNRWFGQLRPIFEAQGYYIYNCNSASALTCFDYIPFAEAIKFVVEQWGNIDVTSERTEGLYDQRKS